MKQFLVPGSIEVGREICLREDDYHYLVHVRRARIGTVVPVVDRFGKRGKASVSQIGSTELLLSVTDLDQQTPGSAAPDLVLCQAIPKGRRFDQVIRGAIQAGAGRIVPLITRHTIVRANDDWDTKMDRWSRV